MKQQILPLRCWTLSFLTLSFVFPRLLFHPAFFYRNNCLTNCHSLLADLRSSLSKLALAINIRYHFLPIFQVLSAHGPREGLVAAERFANLRGGDRITGWRLMRE